MTKKEKLQTLLDNGIIPVNETTNEINKAYDSFMSFKNYVDGDVTKVDGLFERDDPKTEPTPETKPKTEPTPEPDEGDEWEKLTEDLGKKSETVRGDIPPLFEDNDKKPLIETTRKRKSKKESEPDSFRIEGFILLIAIDVVFPTAIKFLNDKLLKKQGIPLDMLRLTDEQMKKIEPLANQAADYMKVNINPITGFLIASGFMYTNNYINSGYLYTEKKR